MRAKFLTRLLSTWTLVALSSVAVAGARTVVLCDSENPPYSIGDEDGSIAEGGVAVALAEAVFDRLEGEELEVRLMPWSRCLQEARTGSVDGVLKLFRTEERQEYLGFTTEPLYRMNVVFFYLPDRFPDGLVWNELSDLSEYTLGVVDGSSSGAVMDAAIREGVFRTDPTTRDVQNIRKLAGGRIDLFADDRIMGRANVRSLGLDDRIEASDQVIDSQPIHLGISKESEALLLLPEIDRVLRELRESGVADEILEAIPE